jgi:hypothetical protein
MWTLIFSTSIISQLVSSSNLSPVDLIDLSQSLGIKPVLLIGSDKPVSICKTYRLAELSCSAWQQDTRMSDRLKHFGVIYFDNNNNNNNNTNSTTKNKAATNMSEDFYNTVAQSKVMVVIQNSNTVMDHHMHLSYVVSQQVYFFNEHDFSLKEAYTINNVNISRLGLASIN